MIFSVQEAIHRLSFGIFEFRRNIREYSFSGHELLIFSFWIIFFVMFFSSMIMIFVFVKFAMMTVNCLMLHFTKIMKFFLQTLKNSIDCSITRVLRTAGVRCPTVWTCSNRANIEHVQQLILSEQHTKNFKNFRTSTVRTLTGPG